MKQADEDEFGRLLEAFHEAQERGDLAKAEAIGMQCMILASRDAEEGPSESLRLVIEAREHEDAARWEQAEAAHRRAIAQAEAEGIPGMIFKAHDNLSDLYALRGMAQEALVEAEAALAAARQADMAPVLGMALGGLGRCYLRVGDLTSATRTADEFVSVVPAGRMYDLQRARALVLRARCRVDAGEIEPAQQDLEVSWRILAPQAGALTLAGVQSALASWWDVAARIKTLQSDAAGAADAMGKLVEFRRRVSQAPQVDGPYKYNALAAALHRYGVALLAANDLGAASDAFAESRAIQRKIGVAIESV